MKQITPIRIKSFLSLVLIIAFGSSSFGDIVELTPFQNEAPSATNLEAGGPFTSSLNGVDPENFQLVTNFFAIDAGVDSENTIQFFALNDDGPIGIDGNFAISDVSATAVPEPSTAILLLLASVALLSTRRRRR